MKIKNIVLAVALTILPISAFADRPSTNNAKNLRRTTVLCAVPQSTETLVKFTLVDYQTENPSRFEAAYSGHVFGSDSSFQRSVTTVHALGDRVSSGLQYTVQFTDKSGHRNQLVARDTLVSSMPGAAPVGFSANLMRGGNQIALTCSYL